MMARPKSLGSTGALGLPDVHTLHIPEERTVSAVGSTMDEGSGRQQV